MKSKSALGILLGILWCISALASPSRILFFAPHPDDEMLGPGAQIRKAEIDRRHGLDVDYRVVLMTCGDGYETALDLWKASGKALDLNGDGKINYLDLGMARHKETLAGMKALNVPAEKVIFLGYPDGGLSSLSQSGSRPYLAPLTEVSQVPYPFAFHPGAPYLRDSAISDLEKIILSFQPTLVYTPTATDQHPDHAMTRELVKSALYRVAYSGVHLEYLIHWEQNEEGWPHPTSSWGIPKGHIPPDRTVTLSSLSWTRTEKSDGIKLYSTQIAADGDYLTYFAKDQEIFWFTRPNYSDYLKP